jgi:urease accessory protein
MGVVRATQVRPGGAWSGPSADRVVLDYDGRHRRRVAMRGEGGTDFLLDLAETTVLNAGDAVVLDDGRLVEVEAAPEPLLEIVCRDGEHRTRVAWHLGNRHLACQIAGEVLRIRRDPVIADMVRGLGAEVSEVEAPFTPEGGAYAHGGHAHD